MLDASKAFDHVNYCKLFRILLEKKTFVLYIVGCSSKCMLTTNRANLVSHILFSECVVLILV